MTGRDFPKQFLFGAATSAYQVEGGIENDWSRWERAGRTKTACGRAVDHWNRFESDVELLVDAGLSAYRFSVEWARLEPSPGRFDDVALARYVSMLDLLKKRGIQAMVTLHHFTHPVWFHDRTPWTSPRSVKAFERFVAHVAPAFQGKVSAWCTVNEPMVFLLGGYADGLMPPGIHDLRLFGDATENLLRAHVAARAVLKSVDRSVPVGLAHNVMGFAPLRPNSPLDRLLSSSASALFSHAIPRALTEGTLELRMPLLLNRRTTIDGGRGSLDFLGVNFYSRLHVGAQLGGRGWQAVYRDPSSRGLTDLGWEVHPDSFAVLLAQLREHGLPIWITENGIADESGTRREAYLREHLRVVSRAIKAGVDIRGYLHWSLLDNFEWLEGIGPRFGLYRVDFDTLERTPAAGHAFLKRVATTGRIDP